MEPLDLTPDMLLRAYAIGVFPMAEDRNDPDLFWIDPRMRGVLPLDSLHIPRRLKRTIRNGPYSVTFNRAFDEVMEGCAEMTEIRPRTWINDKIFNLFSTLHRMGHAHSVETRDAKGNLVGGLYGVSLGSAFFGESMFSRQRDASKVALIHLAARLILADYTLLDTQFVTEHLEQFGAIEIPRVAYRAQLAEALENPRNFMHGYRKGEILEFLKNHNGETKAKTDHRYRT